MFRRVVSLSAATMPVKITVAMQTVIDTNLEITKLYFGETKRKEETESANNKGDNFYPKRKMT